ncbi:DEAD-box ATP-dependent RNA helicase 28 [Vitis riparia]|uniref:DEAD-box ATP-dependent RNA helicase 28 n=1 Tax=Vitis riparia TaxID=96939 RepID=UPI00155B1C75|nr:DEAD-box ATP-dependent RNA helicase 28 [Vitis riparia]
MDSSFVFEVPSDEEPEYEPDEDEEEEGEGEGAAQTASQSPWDFASYSETVAEEHARRSTTSVDFKISKALEQRRLPIPNQDDSSESESDHQEDYTPEDADEAASVGGDRKSFFAPADGASFHANSFLELNLSRPLLRACEALGYTKPTPIQAACIPIALTGRDICGSAITGSGKTAAFSLPTLERLLFRPKRVQAIRVLVLTPTRELAVQVHSMMEKLAQFTDIRCCLIVGGLSSKMQETALRSMPDVVVATPGRMIDHLRNSMSVDLEDLAVLILDEADRLLELGFNAEIRELVRLCPKRRQTMLFSATMTEEVDELVKLSMTKPMRLAADPSTKRPATLTEEVVRIRRMREVNQEAVLLALCSKTFTAKAIIFSGTKQAAHRLKILFGLAGFKAAELHGNLTQVQRLDALELFRKQQVDFLIATDVAARGLDIIGVQTVINYACPRDLTSYVHRVGRTARAGREGYAVTFVTDNDRSLLKSIVKRAGSKLRSRIVAEQSIIKWSHMIEQMEDQVAAILQEEREERILRKAEMEATKAENMIAHKDDIYSRPKRTWFATEKEKKSVAKAAKDSLEKENGSGNNVISAQQAEDLKMKEKRKREREKNLPRKKRRKLEAARERLEDENQIDKLKEGGRENKKEKAGSSLVGIGYRRAKAVKAVKKAQDAGKIGRKANKKSERPSQTNQSRSEEMQELFQSDMSERKQKRSMRGAGKKKSKNSFKSKSRYKRK